jgi:hypothetical protein
MLKFCANRRDRPHLHANNVTECIDLLDFRQRNGGMLQLDRGEGELLIESKPTLLDDGKWR